MVDIQFLATNAKLIDRAEGNQLPLIISISSRDENDRPPNHTPIDILKVGEVSEISIDRNIHVTSIFTEENGESRNRTTG